MPSAPPIDVAREWLADADPEPAHAYRWWETPDGTALLPLGRAFDAVEVPPHLTEALLNSRAVDGPVLRAHPSGAAYILVPAGTSHSWPADALCPCLGDGHYLGVPDPARLAPVGTYWVNPPDGSGTLADPDLISAVIATLTRTEASS